MILPPKASRNGHIRYSHVRPSLNFFLYVREMSCRLSDLSEVPRIGTSPERSSLKIPAYLPASRDSSQRPDGRRTGRERWDPEIARGAKAESRVNKEEGGSVSHIEILRRACRFSRRVQFARYSLHFCTCHAHARVSRRLRDGYR